MIFFLHLIWPGLYNIQIHWSKWMPRLLWMQFKPSKRAVIWSFWSQFTATLTDRLTSLKHTETPTLLEEDNDNETTCQASQKWNQKFPLLKYSDEFSQFKPQFKHPIPQQNQCHPQPHPLHQNFQCRNKNTSKTFRCCRQNMVTMIRFPITPRSYFQHKAMSITRCLHRLFTTHYSIFP